MLNGNWCRVISVDDLKWRASLLGWRDVIDGCEGKYEDILLVLTLQLVS
jgi:hypothetical protein